MSDTLKTILDDIQIISDKIQYCRAQGLINSVIEYKQLLRLKVDEYQEIKYKRSN